MSIKKNFGHCFAVVVQLYLISCLFIFLFYLLTAVHFSTNLDAAKTKRASVPTSTSVIGSVFPLSSWLSDISRFPCVTATTTLAHLMKTGKLVSSGSTGNEGPGVVLVKKPVDLAQEFYFGGYAHDVTSDLTLLQSPAMVCWR